MCYKALVDKGCDMSTIYNSENDIIVRELEHLDKLTHGEH